MLFPFALLGLWSIVRGVDRYRTVLHGADQRDTGILVRDAAKVLPRLVDELRQQLRELVSGRKQASKLLVNVVSFGFQNGPPAEADLMFDMRFLKNPHWVPALRPKTGRVPPTPRKPLLPRVLSSSESRPLLSSRLSLVKSTNNSTSSVTIAIRSYGPSLSTKTLAASMLSEMYGNWLRL